MLKDLNLKEKDSVFHQYVRLHIGIGKDKNNPLYEEYHHKYKRWVNDFIYSHGELNTQRKINYIKISCTFDIDIKNQNDVFEFIFSIDSFYLAFLALCAARKLDSDFSEEKVLEYISLSFFKDLDIGNYFYPSSTFLGLKNEDIFLALLNMAKKIVGISFTGRDTDIIRELFHELYPREVRHSLGEFYTPDWLAQHIVESNLGKMKSGIIIDPTCGSGTFLITVINNDKISDGIDRVLGFDINPTTTFAAKTNLILNSCYEKIINKVLPVFNANILGYIERSETLNSYDDAIQRIKEICRNDKSSYDDDDIDELETISRYMTNLSKGRASIAIGNPPWVNWEYLPFEYREEYKDMWQDYGLFDYKGINSIFIKEDISSLITYVTISHYLKENGSISFIVKESLFKSIKQAAGFRKFYISKDGVYFGVKLIEDLTRFNPFNGVSNNTIIFHAVKHERTEYPIRYVEWSLINKEKMSDTDCLKEVEKKIFKNNKLAVLSNPSDQTSGLASMDEELHKTAPKLIGNSFYKARTGVFTGGANGIFWLNIRKKMSDKSSLIENITEKAKIKFKKITSEIENDMLYPYASGSDIRMWSYTYKKYIICPHTRDTKMYPIPLNNINDYLPLTASFFREFEQELKRRKGFTSFDKKIHEEYFYTLQRIGEYTFAKYKVAWKYISSSFTCAVICDVNDAYLGEKTIIPNEKIIYIGLNDKDEAYYLCGILSSSYFRDMINSFKVSTQIAPSIINNLNIPKYDGENNAHIMISALCEKGHGDLKNIDKYISDIDNYVIDAISV